MAKAHCHLLGLRLVAEATAWLMAEATANQTLGHTNPEASPAPSVAWWPKPTVTSLASGSWLKPGSCCARAMTSLKSLAPGVPDRCLLADTPTCRQHSCTYMHEVSAPATVAPSISTAAQLPYQQQHNCSERHCWKQQQHTLWYMSYLHVLSMA